MPTPTLLLDLRAVRELLSDPDRWTQGSLAMDPEGNELDPCDEAATCWCVVGAIVRVTDGRDEKLLALSLVNEVLGSDSIEDWNDAPNRTHPEVLALIDKAIAAAEAEAE